MTRFSVLATIAWLAAGPASADIRKIDRSIGKEPAYRTNDPKYCLLVFGPKAKTRVWLVLDGDVLHVDRNGNGNLTDAGEKIAAEKVDGADVGDHVFKVGDVRDGTLTHRNLTVSASSLEPLAGNDEQVKQFLARSPGARRYGLWLDVDVPGWKGTSAGGRVVHSVSFRDRHGILQFAGKPENAPVIHLRGPRQITFVEPNRLTAGRETEIFLAVTTPGVGEGTTVRVAYEGVVPEKAHPKIEITYPPGRPGAPPVKELYELTERC